MEFGKWDGARSLPDVNSISNIISNNFRRTIIITIDKIKVIMACQTLENIKINTKIMVNGIRNIEDFNKYIL